MAVQSGSSSFLRSFAAMALLLAVLSGCLDDVWRGNVAIINGTGITLNQVAALRNSMYFEWTSTPLTEMEDMRKQYGEALTNLLSVALVKQYLKRKKLEVTAAEVATEEERIRADYPPGTFEDMIINEAIDMESWRFLLLNALSVQRFLDKVLRPNIIITPEEVAAYLKAHPEEFVRPPWVHFYIVSSGVREDVELCAKELAQSKDPVSAQTNNPDVVIRTTRMDIPRLPLSIAAALAKVKTGQLSEVLKIEGEFHQMLLVERLEEHSLDAGEAYLQIEQTLLDTKYGPAYNQWISQQMAKADIKVAEKLLREVKAAPRKNIKPNVAAKESTSGNVPVVQVSPPS